LDILTRCGLEGEMDAGGRALGGRHPQLVGRKVARALAAERASQGRQRRPVETPTGLEVGRAEVDVVEQPSDVKFHGAQDTPNDQRFQ
jgi:transcriptional regulator GlxA family with amidase domain